MTSFNCRAATARTVLNVILNANFFPPRTLITPSNSRLLHLRFRFFELIGVLQIGFVLYLYCPSILNQDRRLCWMLPITQMSNTESPVHVLLLHYSSFFYRMANQCYFSFVVMTKLSTSPCCHDCLLCTHQRVPMLWCHDSALNQLNSERASSFRRPRASNSLSESIHSANSISQRTASVSRRQRHLADHHLQTTAPNVCLQQSLVGHILSPAVRFRSFCGQFINKFHKQNVSNPTNWICWEENGIFLAWKQYNTIYVLETDFTETSARCSQFFSRLMS